MIWRIFYDPLLAAIQQDDSLGYTIEPSTQPSRDAGSKKNFDTVRIATLAYADDTVWVQPNKWSMQRTIEVLNEFYELNDINGKKSELITINTKEEDIFIVVE